MRDDICPICGQYEFDDEYDICPVCGWCHDLVQEGDHEEEECANEMSFNQAKEAWAKGEKIV